jgi:hypothetical protein
VLLVKKYLNLNTPITSAFAWCNPWPLECFIVKNSDIFGKAPVTSTLEPLDDRTSNPAQLEPPL